MTDYNNDYNNMDEGGYDQAGGYMHNNPSSYAVNDSPSKMRGAGNSVPKNHSLLPLTIKQLHLAQSSGIPEDSSLRIDGHEVNEITFIGQIMSFTPAQANNVIYVLDDGTGQIDVKVWLDSTDKTDHYYNAHSHEFVAGAYVRVTGSLKTFNNRKNVQAFRLTLIRDPNEITFHFLEAIYVHLYNKMGGAHGQPMNTGAGYHSNATTQLMHSGSSTATYPGVGHSNLQEAILQLARIAPETGISFAEICQKLSRNPPDEIKKEIDSLFYDGALYTTLDDEHYKAT
jgi:replication factor A2